MEILKLSVSNPQMDLTSLRIRLAASPPSVHQPKLLLEALGELDQLIGMRSVKQEVVNQLLFLLMNLKAKGIGRATDSHLLHTLILGKPGVGKTALGLILARIWSSLGILKPRVKVDDVTTSQRKVTQGLVASMATQLKTKELRKRLFSLKGKKQLVPSDLDQLLRTSTEVNYYSIMTRKTLELDPLPIVHPFRVVSRIDFVSEYLGHTALKTRQLLDQNQGSVLFIDEAYSLYQGPTDTYGAEALTLLNQQMTERPDSTIFIFAGYQDLVQQSLFRAQPGLARRFAFTFTIEDYTAEELAQIFKLQLLRANWSLANPVKSDALLSFFVSEQSFFPACGGDTERLLFHCKLVHSLRCWEVPTQVLDLEDIKAGFLRYKAHQPMTVDQATNLSQQRQYERDGLIVRQKEMADRCTHEELFARYRALERERMAREITEGEEKKEYDRRERPESMYG